MPRVLLLTVRLAEGRYHGVGDEPPSPARLFQALVAGAGLSGPLSPSDSAAFKWLEHRQPPIVASPLMSRGQNVAWYVPNNDLDAVGGESRRIGEIRTLKSVRPRLFEASTPFLYAWDFADSDELNAQAICDLSERLYQFGRGVDVAWAWGERIENIELEDRLASYPGLIFRPSNGGAGRTLACPRPGSFKSLVARHAANSRRFSNQEPDSGASQLVSQRPKPIFTPVAYESPATRRVYELRLGRSDSLGVWPLTRVSSLVERLRDGAVERLREALPRRHQEIERVLVGRKADGADSGPTSERIRVMPMPSVGHFHADRGIRRVMVEVPAGCPLRADDMHWAFSGLELIPGEPEVGEPLIVTPSLDNSMCAHYGVGNLTFCLWRTATPAALPDATKRRRIDPSRKATEAKGGGERAAEQTRAAASVVQALRFVEMRARPKTIRVQREPFEAGGERVEAFATGTRFSKERLWHIEIAFAEPVGGPLIIGDGRFLGLGIMTPVRV